MSPECQKAFDSWIRTIKFRAFDAKDNPDLAEAFEAGWEAVLELARQHAKGGS